MNDLFCELNSEEMMELNGGKKVAVPLFEGGGSKGIILEPTGLEDKRKLFYCP